MQAFPHGIASAWSLPPLPTAALILTEIIYLRGGVKGRRTRSAQLPLWRAVSFSLGLLTLFIAIASPIDALDDYLLTAHMFQHFILMSITPPLVVMGAPQVPLLKGLPAPFLRLFLGPLCFRRRWFHPFARFIGHPLTGWFSMNIFFLFWHLPFAYEATLRSEPWHNTEHLCFLLSSILFWWNILAPFPHTRRWPAWTAIPYLFTADLVNTVLSASFCFSGRIFYPTYGLAERVSHLSPLQDQVAAGAEMWVLNSIVFLIPAIILTIRTLSPRHLEAATNTI